MLNRAVSLIIIFCIVVSSCNLPVGYHGVDKKGVIQTGDLSSIANRIQSLQSFGFFPSATSASGRFADGGVNLSELSFDDLERMNILANDPLAALQEINNSESGGSQIYLIATLLSDESTTGDVYEAMYAVDPEMANNFVVMLSEQTKGQFETVEFSQERRTLVANGNMDLFSLKLQHAPMSANSRGVMSNKLTSSSVDWYIGYCITASAGLLLASTAKWYQPWLIPVGIGVAAGGLSLMAAQLNEWYKHDSDVQRFVRAIQDAVECGKIIQSMKTPQDALKRVGDYLNGRSDLFSVSHVEHLKAIAKLYYGSFYETYKYLKEVFSEKGKKEMANRLVTVSGWTALPCVISYLGLRGPATNAWNRIADTITGAMPGVNIKILGISIKRI